MKIAVYSHSIPPSIDGVSRRISSLLHQLTKDGHEVFLFTLEKHPQLEQSSSSGSRPIRFVTLASTFLAIYPTKTVAVPTLANLVLINDALKREKPDVLHCTMDGIGPFLLLAAKLHNITVVGSMHTDLPELLSQVGVWPIVGAATALKEGLESRILDSCATTSPSFKEKLARRFVRCDHIIRTGVQVGVFRPEARNAEVRNRLTFGNPNGLLVVYVGRFGPEKRMDKLVTMCGSVDGVYLALIGDGYMGSWLSERHGSWDAQGGRRTKGGIYCRTGFLTHDDLAPVYASADAHVSCSQFETLGNTVLEAHACGTTVLVPRAQGFVDTVEHERDGFLFNGMRLQDGAAYLARLRDDRALCRKLGERGRAKVQRHSPERVARDMVGWYQRTRASAKTEGVLANLKGAMMLVSSGMVVMFVVSSWFILEAGHRFCRDFVRYCEYTRNALGNSSFFNKISNTYKALSNIPVERETS